MEPNTPAPQCPSCHVAVRPTDYFCFNCGANLKPVPPSLSIGKQLMLYIGSVILAPFGIIWGWRYLRQPNSKSKIVGTIAIVLTLITLTVVTVYAINIINEAQDELHRQLQNVGY